MTEGMLRTCWGPLLVACWRTRGLSADHVPTGSAPSGWPSSGRLARLARKCRSRQLSTPLSVAMCSSVHTSPLPAAWQTQAEAQPYLCIHRGGYRLMGKSLGPDAKSISRYKYHVEHVDTASALRCCLLLGGHQLDSPGDDNQADAPVRVQSYCSWKGPHRWGRR